MNACTLACSHAHLLHGDPSHSHSHTHTHAHSHTLTVRCSRAGLALEPQRGPEAGAVVKAPALLHLGGAAGRLCPGHLVTWGTATLVDGRLPTLHALTTGAGPSHALLETQFLTGEGEEEGR